MLKNRPFNIFLIDAFGAFVSSCFLGIIYYFDSKFGMPQNVLAQFILIAILLFTLSTFFYFLKPENWRFYLKIIAFLNLAYCLFTAYQVWKNAETLTALGHTYFLAEMALIVVLVMFEFKSAKRRM